MTKLSEIFKKPDIPPNIVPELNEQIGSARVVVYSKTYCPYCVRTKFLLWRLHQKYTVVELDWVKDGYLKQRGLYEITGQKTVPNIFIDGRHIGGNDSLQSLHSAGKLKPMLENEDWRSVPKKGDAYPNEKTESL